jgi:16S rRNA (cytidine1402-2'-O)-methyltransferase
MLILVPTPLGNLGDVTVRALETLRTADLVVAEDTRVTRKLLSALGVGSKEIWSYREQNAASVTEGIVARAREQRVALVTDAGMPALSDPGCELVAAARAAGIAVDALPGPSAAIGVAVLSGFPLNRFAFEGFPPRSSAARRSVFSQTLASGVTTIWFESPHRILETLHDLESVAPDALVFLDREYTKRFEQQLLGSPAYVASSLERPVRGEITFAIAPYSGTPLPRSSADVTQAIDELLDRGHSVVEIAKELASAGLGERHALYTAVTDRKHLRSMGRQHAAEGRGSEE